ncbi:copper amine oxidase N-terminal domain-containing protein [Paenibacillus spiritus]|uniref:Copper amine oxidase N-terminal domain-containing protein n=1 Tax=Paenibacillus spiritus TaxID=2496557 RepID=A0A5J5GCW5_9BACL|nr:copper amine oxidase N-terminal domain-containing protein [Paenibacillus spiritus]KAA9005818.1 copper amine oxidase N-terminal domain-containing protein [Paenibacillus spiritus]
MKKSIAVLLCAALAGAGTAAASPENGHAVTRPNASAFTRAAVSPAGEKGTAAVRVLAAPSVSGVLLNDKHIETGRLRSLGGTAFVPLKPLAAAMGYTLAWDAGKRQATLLRPSRRVLVAAGSSSAAVNGTAVKLALPARTIGGTLYVPLASAARALGGTVRVYGGELYIADKERLVSASIDGGTYWVSQADGTLYARLAGQAEPGRIGRLPLKDSPYNHGLTLTSAGSGAVLLELADRHYAMFNEFENVYQVLLRGNAVVAQADYHLGMPAYNRPAVPASTRQYLFDGTRVRYILSGGSLGPELDLKAITQDEGKLRVEYAASDVLLVRALPSAQLYAVHPDTGAVINLGERLIDSPDRADWKQADGNDPYVLERMLTLTKREGSKLTFVYSPLGGGKPKTRTYTLTAGKE